MQQIKSFGVIINGDKPESSLAHGTAEKLWWTRNFKQICFQVFLRNVAIVSDLIEIGSEIQIIGAATEKALFPILSLE